MLSRRLLRIKVIKAVYSHFKSESDSLIVSQKNLVYSIDKTYNLYHLLLSVIIDIRRFAENKIEIGRNKHLPTQEELNPNMKFAENRVIAAIADSDALCDYLAANKLNWVNYPELIRKLYNKLASSEYYVEYMKSPSQNFAEDMKLVLDFFTNEIEDFEELYEAVEEQSIFWADDVEFALMMILRTLQAMKNEKTPLKLLPQFKSPDDLVFAKELFAKAIVNNSEYFGYIDANTKNWDLERIAYMDRLIMLVTIAELVNFPTIPVKVTLDEYIEIAKYYSTQSSSMFINGVMDKIVETLKASGKIKKEGRGLVE